MDGPGWGGMNWLLQKMVQHSTSYAAGEQGQDGEHGVCRRLDATMQARLACTPVFEGGDTRLDGVELFILLAQLCSDHAELACTVGE